MFLYEAQRKSSAVAVLLSLLLPGVGNIYADHAMGAVITWALIIGGVAVAANSVHTTTDTYGYTYGYTTTTVNSSELTLGIFMLLGGFIYSPIDAYFASESYNHALAQRLGLPTGFVLAPAPIRTDRSVAWGPALSFRF
jgi:TM2 domain-containing membrane protein YozV